MNKFLLLEAIRQSNLHPTTKSFLSAVLKDATSNPEGYDPLTGYQAEEDVEETTSPLEAELDPELIKQAKQGRMAIDDATQAAIDQAKADLEAKRLAGAAVLRRENERLGTNLDQAAARVAQRAQAAVAAGPRVRVKPAGNLDDAFAAARNAILQANGGKPKNPSTVAELDAHLAKVGGKPNEARRQRLAAEWGIELPDKKPARRRANQ